MLFAATIHEALTPPPAKPDALAMARQRHQPIRHILANRQARLHAQLRAERDGEGRG